MASSAASQNLNYVDLVPAAAKEDHEKVQAILKKFPSKINVMYRGKTAMHVAARNGDIKMMRILVGNNADYEITDLEYNTPLHYAVKADKPEVVKYLLYLEADIKGENSEGQTASQIAFKNKPNQCLRHFHDLDPMVSLERKVSSERTLESEFETSLTDEPAADGNTGTGDAGKIESLQPANICPICIVNHIDCTLECGHLFCHECVRKWKSFKNENGQQCWKCFYCKRSSKYTKIYL